MLDVLNDETSPMEDLFETTFDTENIAYWMASKEAPAVRVLSLT